MDTPIEKVKEIQTFKSKWGGARPGAGRKRMKGSEEISRMLKRKFVDYVSEDEVEDLIELCLTQATDKPEVLKFVMEQLFGKARQNIGVDGGEDGKSLVIQISEVIAKKNGLNSSTE